MRNIVKEIEEKLLEIEEQEQVKILLAVESGSRAWNVASPDSDYDVRFVYVRRKKDYLRLEEVRDTIEWQLDDVLDINGWDLKKALVQFHKSNATLFEWSNSPIVYKMTEEWKKVYSVARDYFSMKSAVYHYYGIANSTYCQFLQEEQVKYKKYFYALRPLFACKYIEAHHCPPPVLFADFLNDEVPAALRDGIEELLELKKQSGEKEKNDQIPVIREFIRDELQIQKALVESMTDDRKKDWEALNAVFCEILDEHEQWS